MNYTYLFIPIKSSIINYKNEIKKNSQAINETSIDWF